MEIVKRPWGTYRIIEQDENYKIKQILIFPHCRTSLQLHQFRSENMIISNGSLTIYIDNEKRVLCNGEFCHIDIGQIHRLQNDSDDIVSVIEVQIGNVLEENDIKRLEDDYGRIYD